MYKYLLFCSALTLSACATGTPPFGGAGSDEETGGSQATTDNYIGDDNDMNNLVYDAANDQLVINNLPFDGDAGRYVNTGIKALPEFQVYASQQAGEKGHVQYYAVYSQSAYSRAGAAGSGNHINGEGGGIYADFGHGGAMIGRASNNVTRPTGELRYDGNYAGILVHDDATSPAEAITLSSGEVLVYVDPNDFDLTGAIHGFITERFEYDTNGTRIGALEALVLDETSAFTDSGIIEGTAHSGDRTGTYSAVFSGPNSEEVVGAVRIADPTVQETGVFIAAD
ncbi:hypothetical protein AB9F29_01690 [Falsihalocynthiibacter sp. S25ZX9]|uniref:hypothetical protein n=1 Tax=Falsihalocynthiibacter sp. S25ZX9 TaxID=3240870 RepID=UPI00351088FF